MSRKVSSGRDEDAPAVAASASPKAYSLVSVVCPKVVGVADE